MKRVLLTALSMIVVAALAVGLTVAYLQHSDGDVNVMTMGNVKIAQHEYERELDANGNYVTVLAEKRGEIGYKLTKFTQAKPLYPATGAVTGWDDVKVCFEQLDGNKLGRMDILEGLSNVQDKFVFVENTGKSDAYVRTVIAYEVGSDADAFGDLIMVSTNVFWKSTDVGVVEIDDNNYYVVEYVYDGNSYAENGTVTEGANGKHPDGIVHPGEFTYNNLAQVYMAGKATNEDVEAIDGNGNGTYDILVVSQAVQSAGFDDAQTALDTAFGKITADNNPWVSTDAQGNRTENVPDIPVVVTDGEALAAALTEGKDVILKEDVVLENSVEIPSGKDVTLNLNGNKISGSVDTPASLIANNGTLTIDGKGEIAISFSGTVDNGKAVCAISNRGTLTVNGGTVKNTGVGNQIGYAIDNYNGASLTVNGGTITAAGSSYYDAIRLFCGSTETTVTVNGGEISSIWAQNPSAGKATEVKGTVIVNGGTIGTVYYENYTTVKVADGVSTNVTPYGAGSDKVTSASVDGYTVYSFVHE